MKRSELIFTFLKIPLDLAMVLLSFFLAYKVRTYFDFVPVIYLEPLPGYLNFVFMTIPIWFVTFWFNGLYTTKERYNKFEEFGRVFVSVSAAVAIVMAWIFLSRTLFFSRLIIVYVWLIALIAVTIGRFLLNYFQKIFYRYGVGVHRIVLLGGNSLSKTLIDEINKNIGLGYKIIKIIDEDGIDKLEEIFEKYHPDEIIIANTHIPQNKIADILEICRNNQIGFKMTPDLFLVRSSHMDIETLAGIPIMEFKRTPLDGWARIIKRMFDLIVTSILLIILSPLMILAAIMIKVTSKGPILYRQERVGLGKNFNFYKFRSMKAEYCRGEDFGDKNAERVWQKVSKNNDVDGPVFKLKDDPRITWIGKLIRKTSIDELPQFFNVLRGDMSLIGPRPPLPEEVEKYTDFQKRRLGIKPGISGLWQVSGRSKLSFDEWVRLDAYYIENWSLWLDLQIFIKTIWVVIKALGAY